VTRGASLVRRGAASSSRRRSRARRPRASSGPATSRSFLSSTR
jgi:hypothetical protein